jgi:hypothetical protein
MLIVSLLCLLIVACTSRQATPFAISTNTAQPIPTSTTPLTTTPAVTATDSLLPDGLIMLNPNHYKFVTWSISFSLPGNWDIKNRLYMSPVGTGSSLQVGRELYIFYRNNRTGNDPKSEYPSIAILFETIPDQVDIKTYSENTLAKGHGANIVINQTINPKQLGLNLDSAIAYESSYIFEDIEYKQYIIHALYQTTGIEIIMNSDSESFASFDREFLFFLKNLSFE